MPLARVTPAGDSVRVGGRRLRRLRAGRRAEHGRAVLRRHHRRDPAGRAARGGSQRQWDGGRHPGGGHRAATDGWVLLADTDGDGSLAGERPVHDYLVGRETFGWSHAGRRPKVTVAANFSARRRRAPTLDLVFDTGATARTSPESRRATISTACRASTAWRPARSSSASRSPTARRAASPPRGSMVRAIDYAIRFAQARHLPLVLNLSFGVGNEIEGQARIDGWSTRCSRRSPPGVHHQRRQRRARASRPSGFPGSARRAISVGATLPGSFLAPDRLVRRADQLAYFSSRGGELAQPDIVTPGVAYSTVPRWTRGRGSRSGHQHGGAARRGPRGAAGLRAAAGEAADRSPRDQAGADGHRPADAGRHVHRRGHRAPGCGPRLSLARLGHAGGGRPGTRRSAPATRHGRRAPGSRRRRRHDRRASSCVARPAPHRRPTRCGATSVAHRAGDARPARRARPPCSSVSLGARSRWTRRPWGP